MITKQEIEHALMDVIDPELGISIVDLGLIYEINMIERNAGTDSENENTNKVHIVMTLTTLGCPLFNVIETDMKTRIKSLGINEEDIEIELVFDPPWSMDRMTESAKAMLGI